MCLLTFFPEDIQPLTRELYQGAIVNDDGHGWAIVDGDQIHSGRYMNAHQAIETFEAARRLHPGGPALFHSRWGTHGVTDVTNVHPFPVDRDPRTLIAHNGVLPRDVHPRKGDPRSDTRILADSIGGRFGSLRRRLVRIRLQKWMNTGNKIVVLTVNPRYRANHFILNEDQGIWTKDGIWYSNDGYLPYVSRASSLGWMYDSNGVAWECGTSWDAEESMHRRYRWDQGSHTYVPLHSQDDGPIVLGPPDAGGLSTEDRDQWERWEDEVVADRMAEGCPFCNKAVSTEDAVNGQCSKCLTCLDCLGKPNVCLCWMPAARKYALGD
jgi:glutamine amidotransferase